MKTYLAVVIGGGEATPMADENRDTLETWLAINAKGMRYSLWEQDGVMIKQIHPDRKVR